MNDKQHADNLNRTIATLTSPQFRDLTELARKNELPVEVILSIYNDSHQHHGQSGITPIPSELDMSSDGIIQPGKTARLTVTRKLEWGVFTATHLEIEGDPANWKIESFRIGNREQLYRGSNMRLTPVRGTYFNDCIRAKEIDIAHRGMDVVLDVTYTGTKPEGEAFQGTFFGIAS
jgi:hypothetical protein